MTEHRKETTVYIAHIREKDKSIQTVSEHLEAVKAGCEVYGGKIGVSRLAGLAGMLHDLGKNTTAFKTYIQQAAAHPDKPPRRGSVDHSTAGGRFLYRRYHRKAITPEEMLTVEWIANCIISHHQGLRDYLDPDCKSPFFERVALKKEGMEEYGEAEAAFWTEWTPEELDCYVAEARQEVRRALDTIRTHQLHPIASALLIKYVFSCLIDADRTNTRQFEEDRYEAWTSDYRSFFERSYNKLMAVLDAYEKGEDADHPINVLRRDMSRQCEEIAERPPGIYTLSIPTGGGKTLASLRYALKHALIHGKERIVYIVPYTTIIEQNAAEIREILKEDNLILEHHSNIVEELDLGEDDYDLRKERLSLARDNWDRPIIFTTLVQFLNTFYAKGTRNARRLHRLSNAVLIFDEVQAVPAHCVSLFNAALNFLNFFGRSTSILCTATQPALDFVKHRLMLPQQAEIIGNLGEVSRQFKRVEIEDLSASPWGAKELAGFIRDRMGEVNRILVILNTKSAVRKLFRRLEEEPWVKEHGVKLVHLSTNMCAAHRKETLKDTKQALEKKEPVICISTQLIEAGVNISFDCVVRSLAGLDSIAQAAGRCNRHGKDPVRKVYVIQSADEVLKHLPEIRIGAEETKRLLTEYAREPEKFGNDLLSPEAMKTYFQYYYERISNELNYPVPELEKNLFDLLDKNKDLYEGYCNKHGRRPEILSRPSFATVERYFEVIRDSAVSVLVPYNADAEDLLLRLNGELKPDELSELLRKAQQYVVNLYDQDLRKLEKNGDIYPLLHGHVLALRNTAYSQRFGVETEGEGEWKTELA
jgi:CRISPR-associated endonuclease/helicase Cas3